MGLRILLVDDDPMMLQMLSPHLEELEARLPVVGVTTADTPDAALAALDGMGPGPLAVMSDFNLKARLNGLQLLAEVEKRRPDAVRILFSGYAREQLGDVSSNGAAHGFVEKPLRIRDMLGPIQEIVDARLPR